MKTIQIDVVARDLIVEVKGRSDAEHERLITNTVHERNLCETCVAGAAAVILTLPGSSPRVHELILGRSRDGWGIIKELATPDVTVLSSEVRRDGGFEDDEAGPACSIWITLAVPGATIVRVEAQTLQTKERATPSPNPNASAMK